MIVTKTLINNAMPQDEINNWHFSKLPSLQLDVKQGSASSRRGNGTFRVIAQPNLTSSQRTGTITIKVQGAKDLRITVIQNSSGYFATADDAAAHWATQNFSPAYFVRHEFGAFIYSKRVNGASGVKSRTVYGLTPTIEGGVWTVGLNPTDRRYENHTLVAGIHNHVYENNFSPDDRDWVNKNRMLLYVISPDLMLRLRTPPGIVNAAKTTNIRRITPRSLTANERRNLENQFRKRWDAYASAPPTNFRINSGHPIPRVWPTQYPFRGLGK